MEQRSKRSSCIVYTATVRHIYLRVRPFQWPCWSGLLQELDELVERYSAFHPSLGVRRRGHDTGDIVYAGHGKTEAGYDVAGFKGFGEKGIAQVCLRSSRCSWEPAPARRNGSSCYAL